MSRFQILSLVGGGIRGAFITSYLMELEQKLGRPIAESFDLIAGTSTGGIIAAGLAYGYSAEKMHDFYIKYAKKRAGKSLDVVFRSRFCNHSLVESLVEGFGDDILADVKCTRLIMPAVNLTKGEPHVFRSNHLPKAVHDQNIKIVDAVAATTAAPTYFPHRTIGDSVFVDGGLWAADPSLLAVAEAIRVQQFEKKLDPDAPILTNDIHLMSVGTGKAEFSTTPPSDDVGILFWASRIAEVMGTSQSQGVHLPVKFFLGDRYRHINFQMTENWGMDDVSNMPKLFDVGAKRAAESFDMIKDEFLDNVAPCFVPFTSTEHEIILDDIGLSRKP